MNATSDDKNAGNTGVDEEMQHDVLRRRLLRASAAAPVIASLTPNSALALSSAAACAGGEFSNKKFEKNGNSINGDTAVRQAVPYWQKKRGKRNKTGWANKLYLIDGRHYDQDGNSYQCTQAGLDRYYDHDTAHVLALFDVSGSDAGFVGLWPKTQIDPSHATPMTGSCWTSLSSSKMFSPT